MLKKIIQRLKNFANSIFINDIEIVKKVYLSGMEQ